MFQHRSTDTPEGLEALAAAKRQARGTLRVLLDLLACLALCAAIAVLGAALAGIWPK